MDMNGKMSEIAFENPRPSKKKKKVKVRKKLTYLQQVYVIFFVLIF